MKLAAISARFIFTPFIGSARLRRPAPLVLQNVVDITADGRMALLHVEPPSIPPFQQCVQRHREVLAWHSIVKLKIHAADHLGTAAALLQPEQVLKEVKVWKNSEIRLAEMDKHRNIQNSVRMKITQAHSPILQQILLERMYQKS